MINAYDNRDDFLLNMTNRGRGRPSRRRGFDDDFAFDRAPPGDMPRAAPSWPSSAGFGPEHDATVKWFNPEKGFGFVALSDGSGDAFLHANTLNQSGHSAVSPGATLRVRIGQGQKGRQVSEVLSVDESTATPTASRGAPRAPGAGGFGDRPAPGGFGGDRGGAPRRGAPTGPSVEMQGTVKWYNATKGFGFVAPGRGWQGRVRSRLRPAAGWRDAACRRPDHLDGCRPGCQGAGSGVHPHQLIVLRLGCRERPGARPGLSLIRALRHPVGNPQGE